MLSVLDRSPASTPGCSLGAVLPVLDLNITVAYERQRVNAMRRFALLLLAGVLARNGVQTSTDFIWDNESSISLLDIS